MNEPITTTYREVLLTYSENQDTWNCEHFTRPADTLAKAKERIDKILDTEKKRPFKRFKAYVKGFNYNRDLILVEVTSLTEDRKEAWVTNGKKRAKAGKSYTPGKALDIYPADAENNARYDAIQARIAGIKRLQKEIEDLEEKMTAWAPEEE